MNTISAWLINPVACIFGAAEPVTATPCMLPELCIPVPSCSPSCRVTI